MNKNDVVIALDDYKILFQIAKGGQSKVYYAICNSTKTPVAVKISEGIHFTEIFQKEVNFISQHSHKRLTKNLSELKLTTINKKQRHYYALELAENGS